METKAAGLSLMSLAKDLKVTLPGGAEAAPSDAAADPFAALLMQSVAALAGQVTDKGLPSGTAAQEAKADKDATAADAAALAAATAAASPQAPLIAAVEIPVAKAPLSIGKSEPEETPVMARSIADTSNILVRASERDAGAGLLSAGSLSAENFAETLQSLPRDKTSERYTFTPDAPIQATPQQTASTPLQPQNTAQAATPPQAQSMVDNRLAPPVGTPAWDDALGQKMIWMAGDQLSSAELTLNPPDLGPVEIKLSLAGDQASALFVAHHAGVREALDAAIPRLREMLADTGLNLVNVSVGSESFQQSSSGSSQSHSNAPRVIETDRSLIGFAGVPVSAARHDGMVDLFA